MPSIASTSMNSAAISSIEMLNHVIYLDHHATTPCDPRVVEAMLPYFTDIFANPASSLHLLGRQAARAVELAREQVAELIGAAPAEIIFTGGATESNNLALLGYAGVGSSQRRRVVTTPIEHKSVLEPLRALESRGFELAYLPVDGSGLVDLAAAEALIDDQTLLVSVQAANNEIGTIQPITAIAALAHQHGALVHCDAAQAVGKIPVDVKHWDVDFLSVSAHKMYGPKGMGALYVAGGAGARRLVPLAFGGGQEYGARPGTANVPGIVGFGAACQVARDVMDVEARRVAGLRDTLEARLSALVPEIRINGNRLRRLPGNSSVSLPGIDADALILNLPTLALSAGSACNSGAFEPSYVLTAIGLSRAMAAATIRIGLGRFSTMSDIETAAEHIAQAYRRILS